MGNTTENTFVDSGESANASWISDCGKYEIIRTGNGRGFKVRLVKGGQTPRRLRGLYLKQENAKHAINAYAATLPEKTEVQISPELAEQAKERKAARELEALGMSDDEIREALADADKIIEKGEEARQEKE